MELIFKKAMYTGQPVVMMYCSKNGIITKRQVSIETVKEDWVGGFCHLRQSFRRFQKDKILAVLPLAQEELINY